MEERMEELIKQGGDWQQPCGFVKLASDRSTQPSKAQIGGTVARMELLFPGTKGEEGSNIKAKDIFRIQEAKKRPA